jgi:1,4-alpha-glucan branching enzyme
MSAPAALNDGMGSLLYPSGTCRFRVWAPFAKLVQVIGDFTTTPISLAPEGNGNWSADVAGVTALQRYQYQITNVGGANNDNSQVWVRADARALQVESSESNAMSYVVATFDQSTRPAFSTPAFENFILYQLHVGSYCGLNDQFAPLLKNRTGTYVDLISKLGYIRGLGFNAIALLPIADVLDDVQNGGVGEGYGSCDMFASEDWYATSKEKAVAELLQLVDAAHQTGLAVIFDVVYNHGSTTNNRYWQYDGNTAGPPIGGGEYFVNGHKTGAGDGFAVWQREVKDFFLDNGRMFLRDYKADGLRFDATQWIQPDAVEYIVWGLRNEFPDKYLIAEYNPGDPLSAAGPLDPFNTLGFDGTWDLASPGQAYNALSGANPVNNLLTLIGNFGIPNPWCSVRYLTGSHDQIYDQIGSNLSLRYIVERFGGRTNGWALAKGRLAWALNVALPGTPMLFMGTDGHLDGYWDPDDDHGEHRVDWARMGDPTGSLMQRMVTDVNNLRWQHPALRSPAGNVVHVDFQGQVVAFKRYTLDGDIILVIVNVSDSQWPLHNYAVNMGGESGSWMECFNSQSPAYGGINTTGNFGESLNVWNNQLFINLSSWCVAMFRKM